MGFWKHHAGGGAIKKEHSLAEVVRLQDAVGGAVVHSSGEIVLSPVSEKAGESLR